MQRRSLALGLVLIIIGGLLLSGCSSTSSSAANSNAVQTIQVILSDASVKVNPEPVSAGTVNFVIRNHGALEHEFVVLKTDLNASALQVPTGADKVDEEASGQNVGETEGISPGGSKELRLRLQPGNYVLLCNLPGHYEAGMRAAFQVK